VLIRERNEASLQIDAAEAAYRSGRGSQTDVFAARSSTAQIEERIIQINQQIATARTILSRWVGDAGDRPMSELPPLDAVRLTQADLETALEHHPQIAVMARQEDMARADAQIARTNQRSDWSVELDYSQRGPGFSDMVSLNLSIPLQWNQKNLQNRELAAKLALAEQMRDEREEAVRTHVAEARSMLQEWRSDRDRLAFYEASLVPLAGERTKAALAAYRAGPGMLSAVLEARRAEIDTRVEQIRLEMDTARLWSQLNYLVPVGHAAPNE
jgi:outer membrane protein TolC